MSAALRLGRLVAREASRAADFAALTEACEGAWPGEVKRVLAASHCAEARRLLADVSRPSGRVPSDRRLPLAHPLDADWRFTCESAERVLDTVLAATSPAGDILLIAMPTVALAAHDRGLTHRVVVASRIGDPIDAALRAAMPACRFVDLRAIPAGAFRTVAIDPPWYDDVALPLIEAARDAAAPDGRVFVCAPDRLTSPSSARHLCALPDAPQTFGFSAVESADRVRYATPFFELRSLQAAGIANVSPRWRTGLLHACTPRPRAPQARREACVAGDGWREVRHGAIRVWIRQRAERGDAADVAVARSVSRTDRARDVAAVWTSGNTYAANVGAVGPDVVGSAADDPACPWWRQRFHAAMLDELSALGRAVDFY